MKFSRAEELESSGDQFYGRHGFPIDAEASYDDFDDLWAPFPTGVGPRAPTRRRGLDPKHKSSFGRSSEGGSATCKGRSRSPPAPGARSVRALSSPTSIASVPVTPEDLDERAKEAAVAKALGYDAST